MLKIDHSVRRDFIASIPVFLLAIPLCLGIAHASGLPLFSGLLSGVIGGIVVSLISKSQVAITGPAAGLTAIILTSMHSMHTFPSFLTCLVLAGFIQITLGFLKAGFLVRFLPNSVMRGMLCAIGLILIIKEIPHFLGYDIEEFGLLEFFLSPHALSDTYPKAEALSQRNTFTVLKQSFELIHPGSFLVSVVSLATMILWSRKVKGTLSFIPSALVTVLVGTGTSLLLSLTGEPLALDAKNLISIPSFGNARELFNAFQFPNLGALLEIDTYKVAIAIAVTASIESLLTIEAIDGMRPEQRSTSVNRELIAQGVGNSIAGILGGLPMTAVLARSKLNLDSGAETKRSAAFQGLWILIGILFFSSAMRFIPIGALASVLIVTGFHLVDRKMFKTLYDRGAYQFVPFIVTIVGIFFTDLLSGVALGLLSAFLFILRTSYYDSSFKEVRSGNVHKISLGEDASFLLKAKLSKVLSRIPEGGMVEIDGSLANHIDDDIVDVISNFKQSAKRKNIIVVTGGIRALADKQPEVYQAMDERYQNLIDNNKVWVKEKLGEDPEFFQKLSAGQAPHFLFIGCSDSRVPLETITKAQPGDMFIHRNIANVVNLSDVNFLAVLQYSVEVLNVRHIIVCGHYECGGVRAALSHKSLGLIDNWILSVKMSVKDRDQELEQIADLKDRERRAVEIHTEQQVKNLYKNPIIQSAISKFGFPKIHGWVYDIKSGYIKDLDLGDVQSSMEPIFKFIP